MQWILNLNRTSENTYTGYTGSRASPFAVGATIAVHVAIGALVWMLPPGTLKDKVPDILWVHFEKAPPPKPEVVPQQDKKEQPFQRHEETRRETVLATKTLADPDGKSTEEVLGGGGGSGTLGVDTQIIREPVVVSAAPDPKRIRDFQPPYPPAMIRAQVEGFATVKVYIDEAGKVISVELVDTNDSAFWKATQQQALKSWRFRPATRDGEPVASERVMTVRFRLADL